MEVNKIYCGDFRNFTFPPNSIFIFDPPYNQNYKYDTYNDNLSWEDYAAILSCIAEPRVVISYPEQTINVLTRVWESCDEVVTWHYSTRTPKHFRLITWWGCKPDFKKVREPYMPATLKDKRNQHKLKDGRAITDVWEIPYVNNMNKEKTEHPCQMPIEVMERIILTTVSKDQVVIDPFCGSGSTLVAAKKHGYNYIGIDVSEQYCEIANNRLK